MKANIEYSNGETVRKSVGEHNGNVMKKEEKRACTNCGTSNFLSNKACYFCGSRLTWNEPAEFDELEPYRKNWKPFEPRDDKPESFWPSLLGAFIGVIAGVAVAVLILVIAGGYGIFLSLFILLLSPLWAFAGATLVRFAVFSIKEVRDD